MSWYNQYRLGEGAKKRRKKLTNVSFAFTHTYTPVKTKNVPFFPQAYMENFEKCAKTKKQYVVPCYLWLLVFSPNNSLIDNSRSE